MSKDYEKKKVDTLLAEYHACNLNRNHFESTKWLLGSIFIAASFTVLGISFLDVVRDEFIEVAFLSTLSCSLVLIWLGHNEHVRPYIRESLRRLWEIEKTLQELGFDIKLHTTIKAEEQIRGYWVTALLILIVVSACVVRVLLFFKWFTKILLEYSVAIGTGLLIIPVVILFTLYVYYHRDKGKVRVVTEDKRRRIRDLLAGLFLGIAGNIWVEYGVKFLEVFEMGWLDHFVIFVVGFVFIMLASWAWIRSTR